MSENNSKTQAVVIIILILAGMTIGGTIVITDPFDDTDLKIKYINFKDQNDNNKADQMRLKIENIKFFSLKIDSITITRKDVVLNWVGNDTFAISSNDVVKVIANSSSEVEELEYQDLVVITIYYQGKRLDIPIRISIEFSNINFLYFNNFRKNFDYDSWQYYFFQNSSGSPVHGDFSTIEAWRIKRDVLEYDKCLKCTTRNCQYIVLNSSLYNFSNITISIDLMKQDNDGIGVIFGYYEENELPRFYLLWQTDDHPIDDEDYYQRELEFFNWNSSADEVKVNEVSLYYLEGYQLTDDLLSFKLFKLNSTSLIMSEYWRNWQIELINGYIKFYYEESLFLTYQSTSIQGSVGFASFESRGTVFDNLALW